MNQHRGEITLDLNGHLTLRPTFAALAEIEGKTGHALISLAKRLTNGEATLHDLQAIIIAGLRGANEPVPADLPERMAAAGVLGLTEPLLNFIIGALTGENRAGENRTGEYDNG